MSALSYPVAQPELDAPFQAFQACWRALPRRIHPLLPMRKDCGPAELGVHLPHIGISEWLGPGNMQVLYTGTAIEQASGIRITGKNYYDILPREFVASLAWFHKKIFTTPCGAYVADMVLAKSGRQYLLESLQYPMVDETGTPRYILMYGLSGKPLSDRSDRRLETQTNRTIKDMHFLDLGAGAPKSRVDNFIFHR